MSVKKHPYYRLWRSMRERCFLPENKDYDRYGGRGITCCPEWKSFERFVADMGEKPEPHYTLERLDTDGPYSPNNCRWATSKEQARNRRNTRYLYIDGFRYKAAELAERYGVHRNIIYERAARGLPFYEVVHKGRLKWGSGRPPSKDPPRTHCTKGHEFTAENTVWKDKEKKQRGCRICAYANQKLQRDRLKNAT